MIDKMKEANAYADAMNIQVPTKDKSPYPEEKRTQETYGQYRERIKKLMKTGFDISRLSFADYTDYCRGNYASGATAYFEGIDG